MADPTAPRPTTRRAVTRADVAREAGVSTAVVSYVINDGPRPVAATTAARVREAVERLGYRPNLSARALRLGTTDLIGLIVPDSSNPFFAEYALEIEQAAARRGCSLVVANSKGSPSLERRNVESLANRQVSGLIVASATAGDRVDLRARRDVPVALINADGPVSGLSTLGPDFRQGARDAVEHLIVEHGAATVGLATGPRRNHTAYGREDGWREALARHGLPAGPILEDEFSRAGGYRMGRQLLRGDAPDLPDALFALSDLQAVGLLRALHETGIDVPRDVALVSFDGTIESEYCWPGLTVARQPIRAMAEAAVAAVMDAPSEHQVFRTELVIRRSCGCESSEPVVVTP
ncbi:LacI family DNA-binding transcriptional regulator [Brachybacterium sp. YJGR34]|uniref:LacI family DNA-binding transcriptional regulator n=1 Tax=Brachybacterium sp. YJGR34 TaxID=2059911 RepID=UPI000E0C19CE|nr:LacI family DNA-binding transcriptional regulator [Brachybacterium sp. YJGR34]